MRNNIHLLDRTRFSVKLSWRPTALVQVEEKLVNNIVNARVVMYAVTSSVMSSLTSAAAAAAAIATFIVIVQLSQTAANNGT